MSKQLSNPRAGVLLPHLRGLRLQSFMALATSLPQELLNDIFEWAAATDRRAAHNFCLVSSWTRQIAERSLYTVIIADIHERGHLDLIIHWIAVIAEGGHGSEVARTRAGYVRELWVESWFGTGGNLVNHLHETRLDEPLLANLLLLFPCLRSVGWTQRRGASRLRTELKSFASRVAGTHGQSESVTRTRRKELHLTVDIRPVSLHRYSVATTTSVDAITHLRVYHLAEDRSPSSMLASYQSLTHLSITVATSEWHGQAHSPTAPTFAHLKMHVVELPSEGSHSENQRYLREIKKQRARGYPMFAAMRTGSLRDDWEREAFGGDSIWKRAREFTSALERRNWELPHDLDHGRSIHE